MIQNRPQIVKFADTTHQELPGAQLLVEQYFEITQICISA